MGCDIHMFAEKRNPATQNWERIGRKFLDSYALTLIYRKISESMGIEEGAAERIVYMYLNGDKPTTRLEKFIIGDYIPNNIPSDGDDIEWWDAQQQGRLPNPYTDTPYGGRCYNLFNVLAGVRGDGEEMIVDLRGLPFDTDDTISDEHDTWGLDAHSATHYYLDELLDSVYRNMSNEELDEAGIDSFFFKGMLDNASKLTSDPSDIRFLIWFDN